MINNLKQIRKSREISQESISRAIGISRQAISNYETGRRMIPSNKLIALADYLECSIEDLLREEGNSGT